MSNEDRLATSVYEASVILARIGLPVVVTPAFRGSQAKGAVTEAEFTDAVLSGIQASPIAQVLIEPAEKQRP